MIPLTERVESAIQRLLYEPERGRRLYPIALLVLTLIVWFPALFTGLDLGNPDDFYHITQAALRHTPSDIVGWFTRGYWAYTHYEYRPLTRLSLLASYLIFGPRPWGFHLCNLLLHFACAWLLAAIAARAGAPVWAARLSGAVAAVFPPGRMAVAWINGRQDLLCGALLLAGVCAFLNWQSGRPGRHLAFAAVLIVLSALAKEPGAVAPLVLLAASGLAPGRRPLAHRLGAVALISVALVPYLWLRLRAWPLADYAEHNAPQLRPLSVGATWLFRDLLVPRPYELATVWRSQGWHVAFSPRFPRLLAEQVAFWAGLAILLPRHPRLIALGVAWKTALYLPVHSLYWNPAFTHYRYLPHLGTALLVGVAAWELAAWAAGKLHRRARPAARYALVALGLAILLRFFVVQLDLRWPPWRLIAQGGPLPPPSFCRTLQGGDPLHFEEAAIFPPGERPGEAAP